MDLTTCCASYILKRKEGTRKSRRNVREEIRKVSTHQERVERGERLYLIHQNLNDTRNKLVAITSMAKSHELPLSP